MVKISIRNLTKVFGKSVVFDGLSLEAEEKKITCLFGPSGTGKTTLLRVIAGLEEFDSGEIYIGGKNVSKLPPEKRAVGMVFQSFALYPHLSAYNNIAFPLKRRKLSKSEIDSRVKEVSDLLKIGPLLPKRPAQLSGGERQRVGIARALAKKPEVLLMDEPFTNIDAKLRVELRTEMKSLLEGQTIMFATPDSVEAMSVSDKVAVLEKGRVVQYDTPYEIYDYPAHSGIASMFGDPPMNLIRCGVSRHGSKAVCKFEGVEIDPGSKLADRLGAHDEMIVGVRPPDIMIAKQKPPLEANSFNCEVFGTQPSGNEMLVEIRLGQSVLKSKITSKFDLQIGDRVWAQFKEDCVRLFDPESGLLIR